MKLFIFVGMLQVLLSDFLMFRISTIYNFYIFFYTFLIKWTCNFSNLRCGGYMFSFPFDLNRETVEILIGSHVASLFVQASRL